MYWDPIGSNQSKLHNHIPSHHWFWFLYPSHLRGTVCLLCIQEEQEACKKTGSVINFSLIAELQFQKWDDLVKKIAEIEKGNMGNMTAMQQVEQFQICSNLFSGCYCQYGKYGQHAFQTAGKLHIQKNFTLFSGCYGQHRKFGRYGFHSAGKRHV